MQNKRQQGESLTLVLVDSSQNGLDQKEDAFLHFGRTLLSSIPQHEEVSHLERKSNAAVKRQSLSCK